MKNFKYISFYILVGISLTIFSPNVIYPQEKTLNAKVTLRDGAVHIVKDVYRTYDGNVSDRRVNSQYAYKGSWQRHSSVEFKHKDIIEIQFINRKSDSNSYKCFIELKDGRRDTFSIVARGSIVGKSEFGRWSINHSAIRKIEFFTNNDNIVANLHTSNKFDQIHLKNGDVLSGTIQNTTFLLRTSYGQLSLKKSDLNNIELEGGGQNIDIIYTALGDKMSGIVLDDIIILSRSGSPINIDMEKVKKIVFKQ